MCFALLSSKLNPTQQGERLFAASLHCRSKAAPYLLNDGGRSGRKIVRLDETKALGKPPCTWHRMGREKDGLELISLLTAHQSMSEQGHQAMGRMNEKVILVTGGARGLGAAHARLLVIWNASSSH